MPGSGQGGGGPCKGSVTTQRPREWRMRPRNQAGARQGILLPEELPEVGQDEMEGGR